MAAVDAVAPRRWVRRLGWALLALLLALVALLLAAWLFLRASLAQLEGERTASGIASPVQIERDALGVPTIRATHRDDAAYATGFVHAQERYFQMDLLRRAGAGELAALVGEQAVEMDKERRLHRMRARAVAALAALPPDDARLLAAYTAGVNAGLAALAVRPPEYLLLRQTPQPWQPADTLLVVAAMAFDLQGGVAPRELARGWLQAHATAAQLAALLPEASAFDAPLDAANVPHTPAPWPTSGPAWLAQVAPPISTVRLAGVAGVADVAPANAARWMQDRPMSECGFAAWLLPARGAADGASLGALSCAAPLALAEPIDALSSVGSNNWALAGSRTAHGSAILANDMHLGLRLPGVWFRAVIAVAGAPRLVGVTLPGVPLVVAGSNGHVAWGYTNVHGDLVDFVLPQGRVETHRERIAVAGGEPQWLTVNDAANGPLVSVAGRHLAMQWVMHTPTAFNLALRGMEQATTLEAAQAVGQVAGLPAQNLLVATRDGHIGWTLAGRLPGRDASLATTFPGAGGWTALRPPAEVPRVNDPASGTLFTANSRTLAGPGYAAAGDGGVDLGARAAQIRSRLDALPARVDERAAYAIGLDDEARFMAAWRARALAVLDAAALQGQPARAEFAHLLRTRWSGHAAVDDVGYRLTRAWMYALYRELFTGVDEQLKVVHPNASFARASSRWPLVAARLVDEQPAGWLPAGVTWRALQLAAVDRAIASIGTPTEGGARSKPAGQASAATEPGSGKPGIALADAVWGQRNAVAIAHPFAALLPAPLSGWLRAPAAPQAGDDHMPRVAAPQFGASERLVVAPGHEDRALFNLPGGQSGHPLSPFFLAGHADWVAGRAQPLLPGPVAHSLVLVPAVR